MEEKVTLYTLADKLGMSVSVVSRAFKPGSKLNAQKREVILRTAEEMGYVPNKMASRLSMRTIRICVVMYGRFEAYYEDLAAGIEDAYAELSGYKVSCDMHVLPVADHAVEDVYAVLDECLLSVPDGVILHGLYGDEAAGRIDALADKGIRVVTLNNDIPSSKRLFTSISNTDVTGRIAVELLELFLRGRGKNVVLFSGSMLSLVHQSLTFSFTRHALDANLSVLRHYDTRDYPREAARMVEEAFATYPRIDGVYVCSANSLPICRYIDEHGLADTVALVTSDVFPELSAYLKRGVVDATIYQDPFSQGRQAFESLYRNIAEGEPVKNMIMTAPQIVLRSNLSIYQK